MIVRSSLSRSKKRRSDGGIQIPLQFSAHQKQCLGVVDLAGRDAVDGRQGKTSSGGAMRAAARSKTTNESQLELFTLSALRSPIGETTHAIRPDGGKTLAGIPAQYGRATRSERPTRSDGAGGGGTDGVRTGPNSPPVDSPGLDPQQAHD